MANENGRLPAPVSLCLSQTFSEVLDHPHISFADVEIEGEITSVWRRDGVLKWTILLSFPNHMGFAFTVHEEKHWS